MSVDQGREAAKRAFLLSILIPTRNRGYEINYLLNVLSHYLEGHENEVEIVISDNSDNLTSIDSSYANLRIIRSTQRFHTAEENLLWAFPQLQGEFTWALGDDDLLIDGALPKLLNYCRSGKYDGMTWNSRNTTTTSEVGSWSKVICYSKTLPMRYSDFLLKMGFWSVPAGISLTVFRTSLISKDLIKNVEAVGSPIYSHVSLYALAFKNANFAFINEDLVYYRTNSHDVKQDGKHWLNYANNSENFYRYPWTLGFLRHLKLLESQDAISPNYLANALDISHFNVRFLLLEMVIDLFLEQVIADVLGDSKRRMCQEEVTEIISELSRHDIVHQDLWKTIENFYKEIWNRKERSIFGKSKVAASLHVARFRLRDEQSIFPFERYYEGLTGGQLVFHTPLGSISIRPGDYLETDFKIKDVLQILLQGIELPPDIEKRENPLPIEPKRSIERAHKLRNEIMKANLSSNIRHKVTKRLIIYFLLPQGSRMNIKKLYKYLFSNYIFRRIRG